MWMAVGAKGKFRGVMLVSRTQGRVKRQGRSRRSDLRKNRSKCRMGDCYVDLKGSHDMLSLHLSDPISLAA